MQEIIKNLAHIDLMQFCYKNEIDPSGTFIKKSGRGYTYALMRISDNKPIVSVTFYKNQVPTHLVYTTDIN